MLAWKISKCIPYVTFQISGSTNKIFLFQNGNRISQPTNSTSTQNRRKSHPTEKCKGRFASSRRKLEFQLVVQAADHWPSYEKKMEGVFFSLPLSQFKWLLLFFVSEVQHLDVSSDFFFPLHQSFMSQSPPQGQVILLRDQCCWASCLCASTPSFILESPPLWPYHLHWLWLSWRSFPMWW